MGFWSFRPIKSALPALLAIYAIAGVPTLAETITPSDLDSGAPSMSGPNAGTTGGGSAAESDNAIDVGDYARAESLAADRLKRVQGGVAEIALRLSLIEAKMWQGKFQNLQKDLKFVSSLLNKAADVSPNLTARYWDDQSWMTQIQGDSVKAEVQAREAINYWKKAEQTDVSFLCGGIDHLAQLLEERGALDEATRWYQESLALHAKSQGPLSIACANAMEKIAAIAFRNGNQALSQKMYAEALSIKEGTRAVFQQFAPQRAQDAVFYRFLAGAPNVSRETADGVTRERITANGVTVEAALLTKGADVLKNCKAMVRITNNGDAPVSVLPQGADLIILKPKIQLAKQVQGETLAQSIEKKGESKAKWIRFWGSQATTTSTTNILGNGPGFFPYGGYMSPNFGYGGPIGYGGNSWYNNSGGMTTMVTSVPDFQARERAYQRAQAVSDQSQRQAADVRDSELGPTTLNPMGRIVGCLFYDQNNFDEATLRIPIGKAVFEFRFDHLR